MFYSPQTQILHKQYRINLLSQRDAAGNARLIAALQREVRALQRRLDNGNV